MSEATLKHKLEAQHEKNTEQAWNLSLWPKGMSKDSENRLYVATSSSWRGYFVLSKEALFSPDSTVPFTLLFDTRTWTRIEPEPVRHFRGFTYKVPGKIPDEAPDRIPDKASQPNERPKVILRKNPNGPTNTPAANESIKGCP